MAAGYRLYGLYFGPHQYENIPVFTADAIYVNGDTAARLDREGWGLAPEFVSRFTDLFGEWSTSKRSGVASLNFIVSVWNLMSRGGGEVGEFAATRGPPPMA